MTQNLYQVDAFAEAPFEGNPAAVVLLDHAAEADWCQQVAAEMNLSETAFVESANAKGVRPLRWFTPATEVDLCGHATLAAAHVLWEAGHLAPEKSTRFETRSGLLEARLSDAQIGLLLPRTGLTALDLKPEFTDALGTRPMAAWSAGSDLLLEASSAIEVRNLKPDLDRLKSLSKRGVCVTAASDEPEHDFVSRFFAPAAGITEDPVTGSAHTYLGPLWADRLKRPTVRGRQVSRRGGSVQVEIFPQQVELMGGAITVSAGELLA